MDNLSMKSNLLIDIERFLRDFNMSPSKFGRLTMGDPNLYKQMVKFCRKPEPKSEHKIRKFMLDKYKERYQNGRNDNGQDSSK